MGININETDQTIIVLIAIYNTYTFVWWPQIHDDCPAMLAIMRYNPSKIGISHVNISITNGN